MQPPGGIFPHIRAVHAHRAARHVVVPRQQAHQSCFAATRAADDSQRLARLYGKADALHGVLARVRISKTHAFELNARRTRLLRGALARLRHRAFLCQHFAYALRAGQRLREDNDDVRQNDERQQRLRHIVHHGDDLALLDASVLRKQAPEPDDGHNGKVCDNRSDGVERRRELAHADGNVGQRVSRLLELFNLAVLL